MAKLFRRFLGIRAEELAKESRDANQEVLDQLDDRLTDVERRVAQYEIEVGGRLDALELRKEVISRQRGRPA